MLHAIMHTKQAIHKNKTNLFQQIEIDARVVAFEYTYKFVDISQPHNYGEK